MGEKTGKLIVVDEREESRVPFLRGILTRSLQQAGLTFEQAYDVASSVRDDLEDEEEIVSTQLRRFVAERLKADGFAEVAARYTTRRDERAVIQVKSRTGEVAPFSKGLLGQSMEICALPRDEAFAVAAEVEYRMVREQVREKSSADVGLLTARVLRQRVGETAAERYLRWIIFTHSNDPLILLVGGTTGCGKSTLAATLANRLGIVRTQSTDMLREVMRLMVPFKLVPSLHQSSFGAYRVLPRWRDDEDRPVEAHMIDGYLMQSHEVAIAIEGVFKRAVKENVSLILEGVHISPVLQRRLSKGDGPVVVPFILAALKKKKLRRQLEGRGQHVPGRRAERYLDHFDDIWQLQTFLLSESDRYDIPIVQNISVEDSVREVMETVSVALTGRYGADPKEAFGHADSQP